MRYLIAYDLNKAGKDYIGLYKSIRDASNGKWRHLMESTWLIQSDLSEASAVFHRLHPHLDRDDRCLIIEVNNNVGGFLSEDNWRMVQNIILQGDQ